LEASIVGAGVAGLSLAVHLARLGARVRVYEARYPGYSASGRSAGILVTIFPEWLLDLALETARFYEGLPGSRGRIGPRRALWVPEARGCAGQVLDAHAARGLPFRENVDPEAVLGVPYSVGGEAHLITEYLVDTGWVINALQAEAARLGVELVNAVVRRAGDGWFEAAGRRLPEPVVVAAGPWTPGLVGAPRGATVYRCHMVSAEGPVPRAIIEDDEAGFYLVPVSASRFNVGDGSNSPIGDPLDGFNPDREDTLRVLEAYASRSPPAWESRILQEWSAPCITLGDALPAAAEAAPGVYILTGFDGAGISLAPAVAGLLARHLARGEPLPQWLSRLDREPGVAEPYDVCRRARANP